MSAIQSATQAENLKGKAVKKLVQQVLEDPAAYAGRMSISGPSPGR